MESKIEVDYITSTISGEGKFAGYPCTMIRLVGCNLKCSFCDAVATIGKSDKLTIKTIMEIVVRSGNKYVLVTGGEPMLQEQLIPLMYELSHSGYNAWIETNGSIEIEKDGYRRSWGYCMDIKCPSSGMSGHNLYTNMKNLQAIDEVKFVISDYADYIFSMGVVKQYPTMASLIFSPCFDEDGNHNGHDLAAWMLQDRIHNVRLGIQVHKFIDVI